LLILKKLCQQKGITALHNAAIEGHVDVMEVLLAAGASINSVDEDGWTPLHAAASGGSLASVDFLLKHGANYQAANIDDETPYDVAEEQDVQDLLLSTVVFTLFFFFTKKKKKKKKTICKTAMSICRSRARRAARMVPKSKNYRTSWSLPSKRSESTGKISKISQLKQKPKK